MTSHNLVPVFTGELAGQPTSLCNARDLHAVLDVGRDFTNWIKGRIEEYGFVEGEDYSPNLARIPGKRGQPRTDYHLTLDMAKELAMVENNDKGRQVRRYFIEVEKKAKAQPAALPPPPKRRIKTRDDLSFTKRDEEGRLVNWSVAHDRNGNWSEGVAKGERFFSEVAELAAHDEHEAFNAIRWALSGSFDFKRGPGTEFQNGGWGAEDGFAESIARAVIDGLRARKGGQEPFDPEAKGNTSGRKALPKPKRAALPCLPMPAQQAFMLH